MPEYVWHVTDDECIDASLDDGTSNWCRFVNHAAPDAGEKNVEALVLPPHGVYFVASREIAAGEQLRVPYGERYWAGREGDLVSY